VPRHDRRPEERARVEHLGVALLVLERDELHGRPLRLREIDAPVADVRELAPAALLLVGPVEVVARHDVLSAGQAGRDRVAVGVVVGGAIRQARDLFVARPASGFLAMGVRERGRERGVAARDEVHARVAVGRRALRAASADERGRASGGRGPAGDREAHGIERSRAGAAHDEDEHGHAQDEPPPAVAPSRHDGETTRAVSAFPNERAETC
jgi:hypothetical protein